MSRTANTTAPAAPIDTTELDKLWQQFEESPALLTEDEAAKAVAMLCDVEALRIYRCVFLMMTKSGRELLELAHKPEMAEVFNELKECAADRSDRLRCAADLFQTAEMRFAMALCDALAREDVAKEGGAA